MFCNNNVMATGFLVIISVFCSTVPSFPLFVNLCHIYNAYTRPALMAKASLAAFHTVFVSVGIVENEIFFFSSSSSSPTPTLSPHFNHLCP